jgi:phospholipase C
MPYPLTASQTVNVGQVMTMTFHPAAAGLINVVVNASAVIPVQPTPPRQGEGDPPPVPVLSLKLELFAPGASTPAFSRNGRLEVKGGVRDRIIVWGDAPAAATQLAADWTIKVTNLGNHPETFNITVRYQTVAGNLGKVDHIVVLMMENRSFDHMLGYRKLTGASNDVDGLTGTETNRDAGGNPHKVTRLTTTSFITDPGHGWTDVAGALPGTTAPPNHAPFQLDGDSGLNLKSNAGFVKNFAHQITLSNPLPPHDQASLSPGAVHSFAFRPSAKAGDTLGARTLPSSIPATSSSGHLGELALFKPGSNTPLVAHSAPVGSGALSVSYVLTAADLALAGNWTCRVTNQSDVVLDFITGLSSSIVPPGPTAEEAPGAIMGYYDKSGVPVYDNLANQFAICDRWFASIPTDTFPNRLYAMAGGAGGLLTTPSDASATVDPPAYTVKTIFEVLQEHGVDWNIFFSDMPFALVFKALVQDAQYTARMRPTSDFLERAATGNLPAVAWLDPNFNDVPDGTNNASDDHPPGDVMRGQQFVAGIFNALANSPAWSKTLFIITYDEHGGFFDHVEPPGTSKDSVGPKDDDPNLSRYGVRVPTMVVTPWVEQGRVAHVVYDHTSTLRTILLRFCSTPTQVATPTHLATAAAALPGLHLGLGSTMPSMGARTDSANSLEGLLSLDAPRPAVAIAPGSLSVATVGRTQSPVTGIGATIRRSVLGF